MNDRVVEHMVDRVRFLVNPLRSALPHKFYVGGGCFGDTVRDLDVFPVEGEPFDLRRSDPKLVCETRNAKTWNIGGKIVQMCRYEHSSLAELIESFDFAHTQVGAMVSSETYSRCSVDVLYTQAFEASKMMGDSWYCGSEYPLSSMLRLVKYSERGIVSRKMRVKSCIEIMADIASRGFHGYDDFKDQLDAVDLGLLPDELESLDEATGLSRLFHALQRSTDG